MFKSQTGVFWHASLANRWSIFTRPVVPSKSECQIIKKYILNKKKENLRILVLGSTPEFRDLTHELKAEVTCIDISLEILQGLVGLMKQKYRTSQETWVKSSWLTMPLAKNYYDFVLGDLVICNVPPKFQPNFLINIKDVLKLGGYFITRQMTEVKDKFGGGKVMTDKWVKYKKLNKLQINYLCWDFFMAFSSSEKEIFSTDRMTQGLKRIISKTKDKKLKKKIENILKICRQTYPPGKIWWLYSFKKTEKLLKRFFKISDIKHGTDHPYVFNCPIYFLRK